MENNEDKRYKTIVLARQIAIFTWGRGDNCDIKVRKYNNNYNLSQVSLG